MSSTLILQIPEPCSEGWDNMSPTDNGRHCHSCSRELIDFTKWSDSRVVEYVEQNNGKICGRFSPRQLNRNLLPAMQTAPSYSGLSLQALVLLAVTLTSSGALAAERVDPVPPFSLLTLAAETPKDTIWPKFMHSGVVVDELGEPIPLAKVSAFGNPAVVVVSTDIDGRFTLEFSARTPVFTMTIESPGFDGLSVTVNAQTAEPNTVYELVQPIEMEMIGIIVPTKKQIRKDRRANRKAGRQNRTSI